MISCNLLCWFLRNMLSTSLGRKRCLTLNMEAADSTKLQDLIIKLYTHISEAPNLTEGSSQICVYTYSFCGATRRLTPRLRGCSGFWITHNYTHPVGLLWTVTIPSQRPLPTQHNTQQTQKANIHYLSGIRTCQRDYKAIVDLRLRWHGIGIGIISLDILPCEFSITRSGTF
jgi:hypothetical protein